jgi:PAS domain S-box-containing protein
MRYRRSLLAYLTALLSALGVAVYVGFTEMDAPLNEHLAPWILLTALFAITEYTLLFFHDQDTRFGLSVSEAILLPMLIQLNFVEAVVGVSVAVAAVGALRWREGLVKGLFNVGSFGSATAAAAAIWNWLGNAEPPLSGSDAGAAIAGVLVFAVLTHVLAAGAVSLATKRNLLKVSRSVAPATVPNLVGGLTLGLLFAAAYAAAEWTLILYPLPLALLFLGYRAVVRQHQEQSRVEHLHAASRALASSPDLQGALSGFLMAVTDMLSSAEAIAVTRVKDQLMWTGVKSSEVVADFEPVNGGPLRNLLAELEQAEVPAFNAGSDDGGFKGQLLGEFAASNMLAVPILNEGEVVGCVAALDRVGADEFSPADARLLEALANELAVTLDSHRLFVEVAEERERFSRIFLGSKEGICLLDGTGAVQAWNPALERITGYPAEEIVGRVWSDRVVIRDSDERRLEGLQIAEIEPGIQLEVVTRQGPTRWVAVVAGPVQREGGGWVVLMRDVTADHQAEEAKSDFLGTISHELRTPLTTIKGALQVLQRGPQEISEDLSDQMISVLRRGSDRLERLVMNLLVVSQMDAASAEQLFSEEFSLQAIVSDRVERMLFDHPHVELDLSPEPVIVRGDRERFGLVVEHLLDNALKYGPPSGVIRIETRVENGYARLSVSDQGAGIAQVDQERIFERFVRLGALLTREAQGAGVGLFIAKRSIEAMEGSIWVDSSPGSGATFHVRIPLAHPVAVSETSA